MIVSFKDAETEKVFRGERSAKLPENMQNTARRKLFILDAATKLETLRFPPGNQLEKLKGNRKDQWSIRINDQWRICFDWNETNAANVEIVDYH